LGKLKVNFSRGDGIPHSEVAHEGEGWVGEGGWLVLLKEKVTSPSEGIGHYQHDSGEIGISS